MHGDRLAADMRVLQGDYLWVDMASSFGYSGIIVGPLAPLDAWFHAGWPRL
jgi:hypothetical protein